MATVIDFSAAFPSAASIKAAGHQGVVAYISPVELWLPVRGYEGRYEVSNHGRVRSLDQVIMRRNGLPQTCRGRVLNAATEKRGPVKRQTVCLKKGDGGRMFFVHRLVVEAFIGDVPGGMHICHNDGDAANNHVSNLRIDTPSANTYDSLHHGTHFNAGKTHCPQGHAYDEKNTLVYYRREGTKDRRCKTCIASRRK